MKPNWLNSYEAGVPATIDPDTFPSLNAMFAWAFAKYKDLPSQSNMGQIMTFAQLDEQSRCFAAFLQNKLGLVKGDRFAIMMPNILQYPVAMLGILRAGGIVVNVNFLSTSEEFEYQMRDSRASGIIVFESFAHKVTEVLANTMLKDIIITKIGDIFPTSKGMLVDLVFKYIKRKVPKWSFKSYYKYKECIEDGSQFMLEEVPIVNTDIAFLQYTGGTTGLPKGAMLTHRNIIANITQLSALLSPRVIQGEDIVVSILPMFHVSSTINVLLFIYNGALNMLITNPFDPKAFIKAIKPYKFSVISGVNSLYNSLMNAPGFASLDFSGLKFAVCGGMELQKNVATRWKQITGTTLIEGYGMTEAALGICCNSTNTPEFNGTMGPPLPSTEISIRNDRGDELGVDYSGEIWVRGPQVMSGYWRQDGETSAALTNDGWLKTGDVGFINEKGFVKLIDRKKDVILISGFLVYPSEVEKVIAMMPEVKEVAVVDAFDEMDGEIVKAYIVVNDPKLTVEKVLEFCKKNLPYYKVPKVIKFRDDLPKNSLGKVLRRSLRYEGGPLRFI